MAYGGDALFEALDALHSAVGMCKYPPPHHMYTDLDALHSASAVGQRSKIKESSSLPAVLKHLEGLVYNKRVGEELAVWPHHKLQSCEGRSASSARRAARSARSERRARRVRRERRARRARRERWEGGRGGGRER